MKIIVLGAGAWGTALAVSAGSNRSARHAVTLWARDAAQAWRCRRSVKMRVTCPASRLPPTLRVLHSGLAAPASAGQASAGKIWSSWPPPWPACAACWRKSCALPGAGGLAVQGL